MSRRTYALAIGSAVAALGLAWAVLIVPAEHRASSSAAEIEVLRDTLVAQPPARAAAPSVPTVSPKLRAALLRAIPEQPMSGRVIETLARAAREAGVDLSSIGLGEPSAAAGQGGATAIPVQLRVRGGYRGIVAFFDRLESLVARRGDGILAHGRLITIGGVEIDAGSATLPAGGSLSSRMQVSAYTMPAERSAP